MLYWHLLWDWPRRFSPFSQALIQSNSKLEIIRTWWLAFSNTKFYFVSLWVPIASLWYFPLFWLVIIITRTKRALIWEKKKNTQIVHVPISSCLLVVHSLTISSGMTPSTIFLFEKKILRLYMYLLAPVFLMYTHCSLIMSSGMTPSTTLDLLGNNLNQQ